MWRKPYDLILFSTKAWPLQFLIDDSYYGHRQWSCLIQSILRRVWDIQHFLKNKLLKCYLIVAIVLNRGGSIKIDQNSSFWIIWYLQQLMRWCYSTQRYYISNINTLPNTNNVVIFVTQYLYVPFICWVDRLQYASFEHHKSSAHLLYVVNADNGLIVLSEMKWYKSRGWGWEWGGMGLGQGVGVKSKWHRCETGVQFNICPYIPPIYFFFNSGYF